MSAQERFDKSFITSTEIAKELNISRATLLHAREKGHLTDHININDKLFIWERAHVEAYLEQWKETLIARRAKSMDRAIV